MLTGNILPVHKMVIKYLTSESVLILRIIQQQNIYFTVTEFPNILSGGRQNNVPVTDSMSSDIFNYYTGSKQDYARKI